MWGVIERELGIPWRAAEAMQLGEEDMAYRAGKEPFILEKNAGKNRKSNHDRK